MPSNNSKLNFKQKFLSILAVLLVLGCLFSACDVAPTPSESDKASDIPSESEVITDEPATDASSNTPTESESSSESATGTETEEPVVIEKPATSMPAFDLSSVPEYTNLAYVEINGNVPFFTKGQLLTESYEYYTALDTLGRCGITVACIGTDIMPTEDRGNISSVKPTGWQSITFGGSSLYNRCHLIAFQLTGENANHENLITGTRYLNNQGMYLFENLVADYVKETKNHVMYRVTPVFSGNELVARGVIMEGYSVEDKGEGICFCVYLYNVQPGVIIDYATGNITIDEKETDGSQVMDYVLNKRSKKFHFPTCSSVSTMSEANKGFYTGSRDQLIKDGYEPCGSCNP